MSLPLSLLACPEAGQSLKAEGAFLVASDGAQRYPMIGEIPWLLPSPYNSLQDWRSKLQHFSRVIAADIESLDRELKSATGVTAQRLARLREGKQVFLRRVAELLMPLLSAQVPAPKIVYDALRDRAPSTQNLLSYEANFYRDWVWGDDENMLSADIVCGHLQEDAVGKFTVLGAGAGRLAYDVHRRLQPELTIATDINPLLVLASAHVMRGQSLPFVEFPLHPKDAESVAIQHEVAPVDPVNNFHWVFADAAAPACPRASFDTVLTPWLIDIQPHALAKFLGQLNHYLKPGGRWVNFGSLVFNQRRDALCYSVEEVRDIARAQGFEIEDVLTHEIPYLKSPYNAGYRMERVWSFCARKVEDVQVARRPQVLPEWLRDPSQPIPKTAFLDRSVQTHRIYAQLAAEVDGRASLQRVAKRFAKQYKMDEAEALRIVGEYFHELIRQNSPV